MRHFIITFILLLTTSFAFTISRPSLDGRAVVAEEGVLPQGLFAKTVGYLPGDSVSVTNPATGITVNVLILGSIDPSAGVAILLSPEAADKLFITPESNTQVKITKRSGMLDESVAGSGTIVGEPSSPAPVVEDSAEPVEEEIPEVAVVEPEPEPEENPADLALIPPEEEVTPEEDLEEYMITSVEEVPLNHVLADSNPTYVFETVTEPEEAIPLPTLEPEEDSEIAIIEEIPEEKPEETPPPVEEPIAIAPPVEEPEVSPPPVKKPIATAPKNRVEEDFILVPANPTPSKTVAPKPVTPKSAPAEPVAPKPVTPKLVPAEPVVPKPVTPNPPLASKEEEADLVDPFAPIILVPAGEQPPQETARNVPPKPKTPAPAEKAIAKNVHPSPAKDNIGSVPKHMVKNLSDLEKGKYYVQIATYSNQESIDQLLQEYGVKYPMVMVPMKSGKSMQMMIGPLNVDEYGAVLAKFKKLGFKDSFLRKIR